MNLCTIKQLRVVRQNSLNLITTKILVLVDGGYFFRNSFKNGNFVIPNDDIQYNNLRDTILNQIYQKNGGTFRASTKPWKVISRDQPQNLATLLKVH